MKTLNQIICFVMIVLILSPLVMAKGFSETEDSGNHNQENIDRTQVLIENVEQYLKKNDTYVGIIARRGAGDPDTGVSDTDELDLSGMAHCGFVIRNGFGKNAQYITFNLVRVKGAKKVKGQDYDLSELRVWTLPHFFIGSFEKDAIVFLPEKKVQLKLWNLLRANGQLNIETKKRTIKDGSGKERLDKQGNPKYVTDQIIANGAFTLLHTPEYNLLSDYVEESTQNCNEHLLTTYLSFRDFWKPGPNQYSLDTINNDQIAALKKETLKAISDQYKPRQMVLSRTKSTFAYTQNIRFGERHQVSPTFFGIKLNKEKFDVVSVDSFCDPQNQKLLAWTDYKVFRESFSKTKGWSIEDKGKEYVKINRFTNRPNTIKEL